MSQPTEYELRALRMFKSTDKTRPYMCVIWQYVSDGGCTHVATDGYTIALRRGGKHVAMSLQDIKNLSPQALVENGEIPPDQPVRWESVIKCPSIEGENPQKRSINPAYFARVAHVEVAAGRRRAEDYAPKPYTTRKNALLERRNLKNLTFSEWIIPCAPLDGWYWVIPDSKIQWEGVIMPRRV